jgi:hypothetical protein
MPVSRSDRKILYGCGVALTAVCLAILVVWLAYAVPVLVPRSKLAPASAHWSDTPIDLVCLWVDGSDEEWQHRRANKMRHAQKQKQKRENDGAPVPPTSTTAAAASTGSNNCARFANADELRVALLSARAHVPFLGRIHLVTDRQVPTWWEEEKKLLGDAVVVDHTAIFPDPSVLPVFNSNAIETCLHRIPGITEHFLYMNDDFSFARPVTLDHYFSGDKVLVQMDTFLWRPLRLNYVLEMCAGPGRSKFCDDVTIPQRIHTAELLAEEFGLGETRDFDLMQHSPVMLRRSALARMETRFSHQYAATRAHPFREVDDFVSTSFAYPHFMQVLDEAVASRNYACFNVYVGESSLGTRYQMQVINSLNPTYVMMSDLRERCTARNSRPLQDWVAAQTEKLQKKLRAAAKA